jgi:lipopolysaccharide heptosyltransferase II
VGDGRVSGGNRILIIKLGALGDVVLASAHMRAIVEAYPEAAVTLLTSPACAGVVQGLPGLEVVAFRRRGFIEMGRVLVWLRRCRFDVVFDLQGSLRSRLMTRLSGARRRIGRRPDHAYTHAPPPGSVADHAFTRLNCLLAAAGIDPPGAQAWLPVREADGAKALAWLQRHGLAQCRRVLLHAGTSEHWVSKRWEEAHFAALAAALQQRGLAVIWIGAGDDRDLNRRLAAEAGVNATGEFSLLELAALGDLAEFAVVNDSGPMHVLAAARLPVYALFGPTDWRRSHALGQAERVLFNPVSCSPCGRPACAPGFDHRCLRDLTPAKVLARLEADGRLEPPVGLPQQVTEFFGDR